MFSATVQFGKIQEKEEQERQKTQKQQEEQPKPETPPAEKQSADGKTNNTQRQRRKAKPELTVVYAQSDDEERSDDQPVINSRPPRRAPAPRKRKEMSPSAQLYIERNDEFVRVPIEEQTPTTRSRRNSFTMREAEDAFLYGTNPEDDPRQTGYAPPYGNPLPSAFVPQQADDAPESDEAYGARCCHNRDV